MKEVEKKAALAIVLVLVAVSIVYLEQFTSKGAATKNAPITSLGERELTHADVARIEAKAAKYSVAREIQQPAGYINGDNTTIGQYVGNSVVLVDFWTYTCINCQRTTPYLNAWYEKYKDQGFVIIGVHSPEFEFEKKYDNVKAAVQKLGIKYPVVMDNSYGTWNAYGNRYWPHKYLIDIDGFIVYDHIGEGGYDETEAQIQKALRERANVLDINSNLSGQSGNTIVSSTDYSKIKSPEVYFGSSRNELLGNGRPGQSGIQNLTQPASVDTNKLYLVGQWNFMPEYAANAHAQAKIIFRYNAKDVYMVASSDNGIELTLKSDGISLGNAGGADVTADRLLVKEERLYKLVQDDSYGEHTLEITVENPGLRAFTFTFG